MDFTSFFDKLSSVIGNDLDESYLRKQYDLIKSFLSDDKFKYYLYASVDYEIDLYMLQFNRAYQDHKHMSQGQLIRLCGPQIIESAFDHLTLNREKISTTAKVAAYDYLFGTDILNMFKTD